MTGPEDELTEAQIRNIRNRAHSDAMGVTTPPATMQDLLDATTPPECESANAADLALITEALAIEGHPFTRFLE